jgi:hypothetical protein
MTVFFIYKSLFKNYNYSKLLNHYIVFGSINQNKYFYLFFNYIVRDIFPYAKKIDL